MTMAFAKITPAHRNVMLTLRTVSDMQAKRKILSALFAEIKRQLGIPKEHRLRVELDDANHPDYLCIVRKKGNQKYKLGDCGRWVDAEPLPVPRNIISVDADTLVAVMREARDNGQHFNEVDASMDNGQRFKTNGTNLLIDLG
jgi:hypothetical protein